MVKYIAHRQNKLTALDKLKNSFFGLELDIRSSSKNVILDHDPFKKGLDFFKNLNLLKKFFLLIDVKSSGISVKICNSLKRKNIKFLLLNLGHPELIEMINRGFAKNLFLRFSLYEKLDLSKKKLNQIKWVWVDFFESYKISSKEYSYLKKYKKKICLTSPDLVGLKEDSIRKYIKYLNNNKIKVDMVCVKQKNVKVWKKLYKY